ncbi:MAG: glutamine amidotransferase [Proteobacteria bacterium]|nr:glutamine amidotransferase [Pseudomonadota bacterium]
MPKIAIVLTNGYADWECAFLNGIGNAYYGVETFNVAPVGAKITSQGGVQTIPDGSLEDVKVEAFDALVICGGMTWTTPQAPDMKRFAIDFLDHDKHVAAICGGTLALANTGILNNKRHTSNDLNFLTSNSTIYVGQSHYMDDPTAVVDQNVITAAGNAPAHFTAAVFRAVGVDNKTVDEFVAMLAREHVT